MGLMFNFTIYITKVSNKYFMILGLCCEKDSDPHPELLDFFINPIFLILRPLY